MRALRDVLEDFGVPADNGDATEAIAAETRELIRLEGFDAGYKAGWDDSTEARSKEKDGMTADLAQNLQDLSFTFHEARSSVISALAPLFGQLVDLVLPAMARESLGLHVAEELLAMAEARTDQQVEIVTGPADSGAITALMDADIGLPLRILPDPEMPEGQVRLRFGESERQIDMNAVLERIRTALEGFLEQSEAFKNHG